MGNKIGKIEGNDWWIVYQSTSMSAYSPVFYSELAALIFARLYTSSSRAELFNKDFSDPAQSTLDLQITAFLNELAPEDARGNRRILKGWMDAMDPEPADWEAAADGDWIPLIGYNDLVERFNANYECPEADIVIRDFNVWRDFNTTGAARLLPQKEGKLATVQGSN